MIGTPKIRGWKAIALLATIVALLLVLIPHATDHAVLFLFVSIFLVIEPVEARAPYQPRTNHIVPLNPHVRSTLFQRPPPLQA